MSQLSLPSAAEEIVANPHVRLVENISAVPIEEIQEAEPDLISDSLDFSTLTKNGPLARLFFGFTPRELPQREIFESVDTPENRYVKAFLERCLLIAHRLKERMAARKLRAAEREVGAWSVKLNDILQRDLWQEIGPYVQFPANSQILMRKRGYKEILRLDIALRMSLALTWDRGEQIFSGLVGDVRPVSQLYEYWCFLSLRQILLSRCAENRGGNFIVVSSDGLQVQLAKGKQSECRFQFVGTNGQKLKVSLFYNRKFARPRIARSAWSGSYTTSFEPDFSIVVRSENGFSHWLHFDAKYRLNRRSVEQLFEESDSETMSRDDESVSRYEEELARVYKLEDLFKMHTYRDGILGSRGSYILFPGDGVGGQTSGSGQNLFVRHPSSFGGAPSHKIPSVGAFDLTPNGDAEQLNAIRKLLLSVFEAMASGNAYIEESAFYG